VKIVEVIEPKVSDDEVAKARALQLPDNFYAYKQRPACKGCPGCEEDEVDSEEQKPSKEQKSSEEKRFDKKQEKSYILTIFLSAFQRLSLDQLLKLATMWSVNQVPPTSSCPQTTPPPSLALPRTTQPLALVSHSN